MFEESAESDNCYIIFYVHAVFGLAFGKQIFQSLVDDPVLRIDIGYAFREYEPGIGSESV
jgi:hypothetical protein